MTLFTVLKWSLPAVIALATIEALILTFVIRRPYNWRSYAASVTDAVVRDYGVNALLSVSLAGPLIALAWQHRLMTVPLNGAASVFCTPSTSVRKLTSSYTRDAIASATARCSSFMVSGVRTGNRISDM